MAQQPQGHYGSIDIETYREHFQPGDHVLVDVRELEEWVTGRIPGATHIPLNSLPDRLSDMPDDMPIVVVCASGVRSIYGARFLIQSGFVEVYNLEDGTHGWMRRGLPLER
jgi:rhodanese-related sulfurtransferase